ncbi:6-phospho-beta-glucosidase [Enterococcus sp. AZ091]|uniref:family 1 glycosylhydrolase n=1 Tax=Enterococcus TaxID=1350 RepID=UPI00345B7058
MLYHLVTAYGGFKNHKLIDFFVRHANTVINRCHEKVNYWLTFNEIHNQMNTEFFLFPYTNSGLLFESEDNRQEIIYQALHNELVASAKFKRFEKEKYPPLQVRCLIAWNPIYPYSC